LLTPFQRRVSYMLCFPHFAAFDSHPLFNPAKFNASNNDDPSGLSLLANLAQPANDTGDGRPPTPPVNFPKQAPNASLVAFTVNSNDRRINGLDVPVQFARAWGPQSLAKTPPFVREGVPFVPEISDVSAKLTRERVLPMREPNHSLESIKEGDWNDDGCAYDGGFDTKWDNPYSVAYGGKPSDLNQTMPQRNNNEIPNKVYYLPTFHPDSSDIVPDKPTVAFGGVDVEKMPVCDGPGKANPHLDETKGKLVQTDGKSFQFVPYPVDGGTIEDDACAKKPPDPGAHGKSTAASLLIPYGINDEELLVLLGKDDGASHQQSPSLRESRRFEAEMAKLREYECITGRVPWEHREAEYQRHQAAMNEISLRMVQQHQRRDRAHHVAAHLQSLHPSVNSSYISFPVVDNPPPATTLQNQISVHQARSSTVPGPQRQAFHHPRSSDAPVVVLGQQHPSSAMATQQHGTFFHQQQLQPVSGQHSCSTTVQGNISEQQLFRSVPITQEPLTFHPSSQIPVTPETLFEQGDSCSAVLPPRQQTFNPHYFPPRQAVIPTQPHPTSATIARQQQAIHQTHFHSDHCAIPGQRQPSSAAQLLSPHQAQGMTGYFHSNATQQPSPTANQTISHQATASVHNTEEDAMAFQDSQQLHHSTGLSQHQGVSNYYNAGGARQQVNIAQLGNQNQPRQGMQSVQTPGERVEEFRSAQQLQHSTGIPHHHIAYSDIATFATQNSGPFHGFHNTALLHPAFRHGVQTSAPGAAATPASNNIRDAATLPDILLQKSVTTSTTTASSSGNGQGVQIISARTRNCDMIITIEKNGQPAFTWPVESHLSGHQDFMRTVLKIEKMANLRDPNDAGQYFGVQAKGSNFVKRKLVFVHAMQGQLQAQLNTPENRRRWCNHIIQFWNSADMQQLFKYPETCRYGGDITPQDESKCQPISHWLTIRDTMEYILQSYQARYTSVADILNELPSILPYYYSDDLIPLVRNYYASYSDTAAVNRDTLDF
jgi:hypothetical protein